MDRTGLGHDLSRPAASLQMRLAQRIASESGGEPVLPRAPQWSEPPWEEVAPGISCKLLASDGEKQVVSMLVRLAPGQEYTGCTCVLITSTADRLI